MDEQTLVTYEDVVIAIAKSETKAIAFGYKKDESQIHPEYRRLKGCETIRSKAGNYLVKGFDLLRQESRTFRIDRMTSVASFEAEVFED